ncbi:MAG: response regulator transcription factor [Weeksellaceae bacterium]|jgi:YesN/AraC family two-component response regulator|nr:response regulator transcription factor [Weeksellaceae bacterium]
MQNLSILLVDDHKLFRAGLKLLLENITYIHRVDEAENGIQCLNFIQQSNPDIVFMDIEMPEMDGITATRKALELFPDMKKIALSIYGDEN